MFDAGRLAPALIGSIDIDVLQMSFFLNAIKNMAFYFLSEHSKKIWLSIFPLNALKKCGFLL